MDLRALHAEMERLDIELPFTVLVDKEWNSVTALCKCGLSMDGADAVERILGHMNAHFGGK